MASVGRLDEGVPRGGQKKDFEGSVERREAI